MGTLSEADRRRMHALLAQEFKNPENASKSERIRRLADAGYKTADIARYLGIRYQFAYNVLSAPRPGGEGGEATPARVSPSEGENGSEAPGLVWTTVGAGGRIEFPEAFLNSLGVTEGDPVQLVLEGEQVRVLNRAAAIREVQAMVRRYIPEGVSLVDELIAERRAEAEREAEGPSGE